MRFLRDTRHLWILLALLAAVGWGGWTVRNRMIPETFGERGPYRAAALTEIAAQPSLFPSDKQCHACHESVKEEREESLHVLVRCAHCHGYGREHMEHARKHEASSDHKIPAAAKWDGDYLSSADLYIARDRKICMPCHEEALGMPADFMKINVAQHLEDQGASEPNSPETCFECHGHHDTAP